MKHCLLDTYVRWFHLKWIGWYVVLNGLCLP